MWLNQWFNSINGQVWLCSPGHPEMVHNERLEKFLTLSISMQDCRNPPSCYLTLLIFFWKPKRGWWKTWSELILSSLNIIIAMTQKNGHIGRRLKRSILFNVLLKRNTRENLTSRISTFYWLRLSIRVKLCKKSWFLPPGRNIDWPMATDHWLEDAMILLT